MNVCVSCSLQNSREHGGQFPPIRVPHPSTPGPEAVPLQSPGTSGHVLTDRDLRKAWELYCHAASDGGSPKQSRTWGAISTNPGPPPPTPGPEAVLTQSPGTSGYVLTDRDLRKARELYCQAASDGGSPKQSRKWGAISTNPGPPPLHPWGR